MRCHFCHFASRFLIDGDHSLTARLVSMRQRMRLTGAFNHRIIDGAMGAKPLHEKKTLENPVRLLL